MVEAAQEAWQRTADEGRATNDEPISSFVICHSSTVEFDFVSLGGLALMERLVGCERAILVDAIQTRAGVPGAIYRLTLDDLPTRHADAIHDASLKAALAVGQQLGAILPQGNVVIGIEAVNLRDFSESLTASGSLPAWRERQRWCLDELAMANSK